MKLIEPKINGYPIGGNQDLIVHLCSALDEFMENNKTKRIKIIEALYVLCTITFVDQTPLDYEDKIKEIDNFCDNLKKLAKKLEVSK